MARRYFGVAGEMAVEKPKREDLGAWALEIGAVKIMARLTPAKHGLRDDLQN